MPLTEGIGQTESTAHNCHMITHTICRAVERVLQPSPWDLGNSVLYELCRVHPSHNAVDIVVAKFWLIGRAYGAAPERRRPVPDERDANEAFYTRRLAPAVIASPIDDWLQSLASFTADDPARTGRTLDVHARLTTLLRQITGQRKRSLASKYLHFHRPDLFFLLDSRAFARLRLAWPGRVVTSESGTDVEYASFVTRMVAFRNAIERVCKVRLTPRQLDRLLLEY